MKIIIGKTGFLLLAGIIVSGVCLAQQASEYREMKLTGSIDPVHNLRYVDSIAVIYHNNRIFLSGGEVRVTVPVENHHFSLWVPPLPAGEGVQVRLISGMLPDTVKNLVNGGGTYLLIGDSAVELSFGSGTYNNRLKKYNLKADIIAGAQNKARIAYEAAISVPKRLADMLRNKLDQKSIDSVQYNTERLKVRRLEDSITRQFILDHPWALQSLNLLEEMASRYLNKEGGWNNTADDRLMEIEELIHSLDPSLLQKDKAGYLLTSLRRARERKVIPFTGPMPDGRQFDFSSLKGKVFLIDFWGSWCIWCRKGNPHLKELYARYKDKGFEIVGVGQEFGTGRQYWDRFKKAIAEDGISWPQILNDPATQDVVAQYMVETFPSKFLVDRQGRIILRVLSDKERLLDAKLKELFGE